MIFMALLFCMFENFHNKKKLFPDVLIPGSIFNRGEWGGELQEADREGMGGGNGLILLGLLSLP